MAVEEFLRLETPTQYIGRTVTEDFQFGNVELKKNDAVLLLIGAANHDPDQFNNPDDFEIQRENNKHLSFGLGLHSCIGALLVRNQTRAAINVLLKNSAKLSLSDANVTYSPRIAHRWLESLEFMLE